MLISLCRKREQPSKRNVLGKSSTTIRGERGQTIKFKAIRFLVISMHVPVQLSEIAMDKQTDRASDRQTDRQTYTWMVKGANGRWNGLTD